MTRSWDANAIACEGWWEESGLGRQPMHQLRLQIVAGQIKGSGWDIVGLFTFSGTISEQGTVVMIKQYLGQHQVEYLGHYDGEGSLWGQWRIDTFTDKWAIKFLRAGGRSAEADDGIEEIR